VAGPYVPPAGPATVVAAVAGGATCTLQFDQPITLSGGGMDESATFGGTPPTGAVLVASDTIQFSLSTPVEPGSAWEINGQPSYIVTPLAVPASGTF
jgi:hypothetical protein